MHAEERGDGEPDPEECRVPARVPEQAEDEKRDRVEDELDGVEPHLARVAGARVHRLVLGDEEAGEERQRDVADETAAGEEPGVGADDGERVERVADALPARQAATPVEDELVDEHGDGLQRERYEEERAHHCLRNTPPQTVSPGPNARLTIGVPAGIDGSARMRIHTCGSVADDMLPWSRRTSRLVCTCRPASSRAPATRSMIDGPPGWMANTASFKARGVPRPARA